MGEVRDESSLNGLFKRDSRLHSFVAFGNDIVLLLAIESSCSRVRHERVGELSIDSRLHSFVAFGNDIVLLLAI